MSPHFVAKIESVLGRTARAPQTRVASTRLLARSLVALAALASFGGCDPAESEVRAAETPRRPTSSLFEPLWAWTDEVGQPVTFAAWRGEPLVVAMFYTSCRKTCPRTIRTVRAIDAKLRRENRPAQIVLVTFDPVNDTPNALRQFKASEGLPDSWHLLSGPVPATRGLANLLGIHVMDLDSHFLHESKIVVFDAEGNAVRSIDSSDADVSSL